MCLKKVLSVMHILYTFRSIIKYKYYILVLNFKFINHNFSLRTQPRIYLVIFFFFFFLHEKSCQIILRGTFYNVTNTYLSNIVRILDGYTAVRINKNITLKRGDCTIVYTTIYRSK